MIDKFEVGKSYVCSLRERGDRWNREGEMDFLLDGKPHKCIGADGMDAIFEETPKTEWCFYFDEEHFSEVTAPNG